MMSTKRVAATLAAGCLCVLGASGQDVEKEIGLATPLGRVNVAVEQTLQGTLIDGATLQALRERVAAAKLLFVTERRFQDAMQELSEIWLTVATSAEYDDQLQMLTEVMQARVELLEEVGRTREALLATRQALPSMAAFTAHAQPVEGDFEVEQASERLLAVAARAENVECWTKIRARLSQQLKEPGDKDLEERVRSSLARGDIGLVTALGDRIEPLLARIAIEETEGFPAQASLDPMVHWVHAAETRAANRLLERFDEATPLFRDRVFRVMLTLDVFKREDWSRSQLDSEPPLHDTPAWVELLRRCLRDEGLRRRALELVERIAKEDALSPALARELIDATTGADADFARELVLALGGERGDGFPVPAFGIPVWRHLLKTGDPMVQRDAAQRMVDYKDPSALVGFSAHPDPSVRIAAAVSLRYPSAELSVAERLVLLQPFFRDAEAEVREASVWTLITDTELAAGVTLEQGLELAGDQASAVRAVLPRVTGFSPNVLSAVLEKLAADPSLPVVGNLAFVVDRDFEGRRDPRWAAARTLLLREDLDSEVREGLLKSACRTVGGVELMFDLMKADGGRALRDSGWDGGLSRSRRKYPLLELSDESLARAFVYVKGAPTDAFHHLYSGLLSVEPPRTAALLRVIENPENTLGIRFLAMPLALKAGGEEVERALLDLLAAPEWAFTGARFQNDLQAMGAQLAQSDRGAFLARMVADERTQALPASGLIRGFAADKAISGDLAVRILERWFEPEAGSLQAVSIALRQLSVVSDERRNDWLMQSAVHPEYGSAAVEAMTTLRNAEFLPVLAKCLEAPWLTGRASGSRLRQAAAKAIAANESPERVDVLLNGLAGASDDVHVRDSIANALEDIRSYEAERDRWAQRKGALLERESAIGKLVGLLDDETPRIRAEAVRALATMGETAVLPRLIEMLKDADADVRSSVQLALDQLIGELARD